MTLDNLIGRSLEAITPDKLTIQKLLAAAQRNINDAKIDHLSNENRFDMAYKAVMQLSNAALQASGYRTLTSVPGHHQTMLQSLVKTVGLDSDTLIELDALRKQRNVADYSGDLVTDAAMQSCLQHADALMARITAYLQQSHADLMD